jgi:hypothetical protein
MLHGNREGTEALAEVAIEPNCGLRVGMPALPATLARLIRLDPRIP